MPKELLDQPIVEHLMHLKEEGLFGVILNNTFGNWYTYDNGEVRVLHYDIE